MSNYNDKVIRNLQNRTIKVIGLGGIGSPVSLYVSKFLYSLNRDATVFLVDGDEYELSNRERVAFREYGKKALVKQAELAEIYGERVALRAVPSYVTKANISKLLGDDDVIFLCVDNHATRKLVSEYCESLSDVLLISGGNDGIDDGSKGTFGNVQVFCKAKGQNKTNSLTQFHPEIDQPEDHSPGESEHESCAMLAEKGAQLAFANLAVASEMLNALMAWALEKLSYEELYLDILTAKRVPISRSVVHDRS